MKNNIGFLFGGIAIGFVIGKFATKKKYEQIANEEIASVIKEFKNMKKKKEEGGDNSSHLSDEEESEEDDEEEKYSNVRKLYDITKNDISDYDRELGSNMSETANIELIEEDDFGNYEDENHFPYETERLYYYADGVIADEENEILHNVDETIGTKCLKHFDEWDSIYVRNHDTQVDYEILKSLRTFEEVKQTEATYDVE